MEGVSECNIEVQVKERRFPRTPPKQRIDNT